MLPNAPDIATTQGQRGCGRCPGAFTVEATAAARHGNAPELSALVTGGFPPAISDRALARRPSARLTVAATDNGLLAPELAAGIARVKSAKSALSRHGLRVRRSASRGSCQAGA